MHLWVSWLKHARFLVALSPNASESTQMPEEIVFAPTTKHIKIDMFPAILYKGTVGAEDNTVVLKDIRLIVTNDYIYAIIMEGTGPVIAHQEELIEIEFIPKVGFKINGANFDYVAVNAGNCGCGNRLRGMRLLPGVPHFNIYKQKK